MKKKVFFCSFFIAPIISVFLSVPAHAAFDPATYFEKKCSGCHSIGGGDDVGPDLKDVTKRRDQKWLVAFIKSSQSVIQTGDAVGNELFNKYKRKVMPDQDIPESDIQDLLKYIEAGAGGGASSAKIRSALEANEYDIEKGRQLFTGTTHFTNGGPSCLSCHSAGTAGALGGGGLGPDLTGAYSLYNDKGLSKALLKISFPSMQEIYAKKPLTEEEVFWVKAFLYKVDQAGPVNAGYVKKFVFLGIIGFLLALGVIDLAWKGRRKKTRRPNMQ